MRIIIPLLLFFLLITVVTCYSFIDNDFTPLSSQQQLGSYNYTIASRLDDIPVPAYVTKLHLLNDNKKDHLTTKDHSLVNVLGKTSYRICRSLQGEKGVSSCSFLLSGRPWRRWRRQIYQATINNSIHHYTVFNNWFVKSLSLNLVDTMETLRWKINDWRQVPSLEWYLLKLRLSSFVNRCYEAYSDWNYSGIIIKKANTDMNYRKYINLNHHDLEPDNDGCYHDIFGTTLCVGEQSLLDDVDLKDRMNTLFEAMTYEERSHTLRYQQRFIHWATLTATMTSKAVDQAQSIWRQHTQSAYQFLDDALDLVPSCTNINNDHRRQSPSSATASFYRTLSSMLPTTETTCPNIIFPFSISPFDTSLESPSFSFQNAFPLRSRSSTSSCTQPTRSWLRLVPTQQNLWTTCNNNQNGHTEKMTTKQRTPLSSQPLERYNQVQYEYMLSRLEMKMMNRLERLEKEALQKYYRAMVSAPHIWRIDYNSHHPQDKRQEQHEQEQRQRPGYATQRMYQELRLYITISFRQLYVKSIQQLMEATRRYDTIVMEQVNLARGEWKWVEQQRQNQIHNHQYYIIQEQHDRDVDYGDRCQQWWQRNKPWRLMHTLSSLAEQLGYYHYNKSKTSTMMDDDYTLLSAVASYLPSAQDPPISTSTNTRAAIYISQRADMAIQAYRETILDQWASTFQEIDRRSHSMWVSAMDQVQGRRRVLPACNSACTLGIIMAKILVLVFFLLYL